uniref:Uncharacterized protein n=1 Tax=Arundo donax TaxID=35708 RepID=A0A0A9CP93_ARUDO
MSPPHSSSSLLVVYTSLTDTAYPLHQRHRVAQRWSLLLCVTTAAIVNVALMIQRIPWLSTPTELTWYMLLPCHNDINCRA